jgi:hypothetical protein
MHGLNVLENLPLGRMTNRYGTLLQKGAEHRLVFNVRL